MAVAKSARNAYLAIAIVLALGVVILANLVADRGFKRWDLTADHKYSLSEPFRNILKRLDNPLKITYCVSKSVPENFEQAKRDILDRLREIQMASDNKIVLDVVDPADNEELRNELGKMRLNYTVSTRERGKVSFAIVNSSLRLTFGSKPTDWVPLVQYPGELEYQLANKIYLLTQTEKPIVAIQRPRSEQLPMGLRRPDPFGQLLRDRDSDTLNKVEVRDIELTEDSMIPENTKLLILIRPKDLGERARYEVVRYLAAGGRVLLLASPFKVNMDIRADNWRVEKTPTGLEDYLESLGIRLDSDFVCDENNVRLPVRDPNTGEITTAALPFFVKILPESIDQESRITRLLPGLVMPFPASMTVDAAKVKTAGLTATVLAHTSGSSWKEPYRDTFDGKAFNRKNAGNNPGLPVFVQLEGTFPFPWEGKAVPKWPVGGEKMDEAAGERKDEKKAPPAKASVERKPGASPLLFVWSCPESFESTYQDEQPFGGEFSGNGNVMPNIVESCAMGEDLIKLRSKQFATRTINTFNKRGAGNLKFWVKLCMIGGTALILVAAGLVYWFVRRHGQVRYERAMSQSGPSSFIP